MTEQCTILWEQIQYSLFLFFLNVSVCYVSQNYMYMHKIYF